MTSAQTAAQTAASNDNNNNNNNNDDTRNDRAFEICKALAVVANAVKHGDSQNKNEGLDAKTEGDFHTFRSTVRFLSRNSWSAKWSSPVVEMLKRVQFFHVERLSYLEKEYAREQCTFRCTLCGTEESQCSSVIHLLGNVDSAFDNDKLLTCQPCDIGSVYQKRATDDKLEYIGVVVPGCSCLGLAVKTLTSNLFLLRAINEASGDVTADAAASAEVWRNLQSASGSSSAVFDKLVRFSDDVSPVFQRVFDDFSDQVTVPLGVPSVPGVPGVPGAQGAQGTNSRETKVYLEVLRRASLRTTATIDKIKSMLNASPSTPRGHERDEIDITQSDDEDDYGEEDEEEYGDGYGDGSDDNDWLVEDGEEEDEDEQDGEEEDEDEQDGGEQDGEEYGNVCSGAVSRSKRGQPARVSRRRVVIDDDDEEEAAGGGVQPVQREQPVQRVQRVQPARSTRSARSDEEPRRETRAAKRAREEAAVSTVSAVSATVHPAQPAQPTQPAQPAQTAALIQASARPSKNAATALRIHPGNALHSREKTLSDLLKMASEFALRQEDLQYVVGIAEGATALSKLLDGKKRGLDYRIAARDMQDCASRLVATQQSLIGKGRIGETAPLAAALLVISEFACSQ